MGLGLSGLLSELLQHLLGSVSYRLCLVCIILVPLTQVRAAHPGLCVRA